MFALYTDGGVVGKNDHALGVTYAYCLVNEQGEHIFEWGGGTTAREVGLDCIGNNYSEMFAVLAGLAQARLMNLHEIAWCTDSELTINRLMYNYAINKGLTPALRESIETQRYRLKEGPMRVQWVLVKGHPTKHALSLIDPKAQLPNMVYLYKYPISHHNAWCDEECGRQKAAVADRIAASQQSAAVV